MADEPRSSCCSRVAQSPPPDSDRVAAERQRLDVEGPGLECHRLVQISVAEESLRIEQGLSPKTASFINRVRGTAGTPFAQTPVGGEDFEELAGCRDLCLAEGTANLRDLAHLLGECAHVRYLVRWGKAVGELQSRSVAGTRQLWNTGGLPPVDNAQQTTEASRNR